MGLLVFALAVLVNTWMMLFCHEPFPAMPYSKENRCVQGEYSPSSGKDEGRLENVGL